MRINPAVVLWSGRDLRRRWFALVLLGLLAGPAAGVAVAAFDGARRSATAFERLREATNASDAVVFPSQANLVDPDWSALQAGSEVRSLGVWALAFGRVDGVEGDNLIVPGGTTWLQTLDRPVVIAGRMFALDNPYEVVVSDVMAQTEAIHVGDHFPFVPYTPDQDFGEPSRGPTLDMTVVGVIRTPLTNTFTGAAFPSPAFAQQYAGKAMLIENAVVQLRHGEADMAALRRDAGTDLASGTPVLDLHTTARRVTATTDVEHAMLSLLAAIVALAGSVLVGQALVRSAVAIAGDEPALRAIGMTRGQLVGAAVLPHVLSAVVAVVVTAVSAGVASRWFPVGMAATVDPDRGVRFDPALFPLAA